ncbi:MAG TPA: DUF6298 domain-containing protein [bacterium]|nr:DUF6298 domain-containing protein [bacterium]HOL96544.1 DUF6298 domain-containing protein [bacterium]HPO99703.1 DUF6298 domain-containing protein [bacterium]
MMKKWFITIVWGIGLTFLLPLSLTAGETAKGPLRVLENNPRYFTDSSGKAVYLTGSHVWYNLVDMGPDDPPKPFDYHAYLDWMQKLNHNFIRLWMWELVWWNTEANSQHTDITLHHATPHPWARTGPGQALDGKPKFDLTRWNPEFFDRLTTRITAARDRGIYVSIMLFEGWGVQFAPDAWKGHPFNKENNVNGVDGDWNGDGQGLEIHTLTNPAVTAIQEAYVKQVIDTVNRLENVLYEISNENHPPSTEWQYHMINLIHEYEKSKPLQHPVGMTFQYKGGSNQTLFDSPADWISPNPDGGYRDNPPANDGRKVILNDTDHLWGIGGNQVWVWKSFTRGLNPIFMDPYDGVTLGQPFDPRWDPVRRSLGYTRRYAERMNLAAMTPRGDLVSSAYCLADPGNEYLVYLPEGGEVTVDLVKVEGAFSVEWFNPGTDETRPGRSIQGGASQRLVSPFEQADAVLYLKRGTPEEK